jgi:hypothetical protein
VVSRIDFPWWEGDLWEKGKFMIKSNVEVITKDDFISDLRKSSIKSITVINPTPDDKIILKSHIEKAVRSNRPFTVVIIQ